MENCIRITGDFIYLDIKAVPGASKSALGEVKEGRLKVRIAAAPEDGKANEELRAFLAKALDIPKRDLVLESGEKSRLKTIRIPVSAREKLEKLLEQNRAVAMRLLEKIQMQAVRNGLDSMTMDEINNEVKAQRTQRRKRKIIE